MGPRGRWVGACSGPGWHVLGPWGGHAHQSLVGCLVKYTHSTCAHSAGPCTATSSLWNVIADVLSIYDLLLLLPLITVMVTNIPLVAHLYKTVLIDSPILQVGHSFKDGSMWEDKFITVRGVLSVESGR